MRRGAVLQSLKGGERMKNKNINFQIQIQGERLTWSECSCVCP